MPIFWPSEKPRRRKPTAVMQEWAKSAIASYDELRSEVVSPCSCVGRASAMWPRMLVTLKGSDAMAASYLSSLYLDVEVEYDAAVACKYGSQGTQLMSFKVVASD